MYCFYMVLVKSLNILNILTNKYQFYKMNAKCPWL